MNENNINDSSDTVIIGNDTQDLNVAVSSKITVSSSPNVIICARCGSEMKKNARYCMKCGNLNYAHPDNEFMKQYAYKNTVNGEFVPNASVGGQNTVASNSVSNVSSTKNPYKACFITNVILFGIYTLILLLPVFLTGKGLGYAFGILLLVGYLFVFSYSSQRILIKGGRPWWSAFIPFYSSYTWFEVATGCGWLFLLTYVPVIGIVVGFYALYSLGKRFYRNGWLTMFFWFVMIPVIGLDRSSEMSVFIQGSSLADKSVDSKGKTASEKKYGRNKFFITLIVLVVVCVGLYFCWPFIKPLIDKVVEFFKNQMEFYK